MPDPLLNDVRRIFDEASEIGDPAARARYLDSACTSPQLRARVDALLASHSAAGSFLDTPAADLTTLRSLAEPTATERADPLVGFTLGGYKITGTLGTGGMGVVYLAEQRNPQRQVAIKVIRSAYAGSDILRRFRHEAAALGRLKHPYIAQIHEAGTAPGPDGRELPFLAMELVSGHTLIEFSNRAEMPMPMRLALFAKVCDGVEHAHQKGVIHRDLKPGNILVEVGSNDSDITNPSTTTDLAAGASPKILDFGVARLTDSDIAVTTMATDIGQVLGTLAYMSPEQVRGDNRAVDTRSDVYALGVILYELTTGQLPYHIRGKPLAEAARIISTDDPTLPGTCIRALKGDIETIILRALEKEPDRRYQSAADLAADLRRHLGDLPIVARPATTSYQLRKFARRNKALVGGVLATVVVLTLGLAGTSFGFFRATASQKLAEARELTAKTEARKSKRSIEFLVGMLTAADPDQTGGREVTVREILDAAAINIESELAAEPDIHLAARDSIGKTYLAIGDNDKAETHLAKVRELAAKVHGSGSIEEAEATHQLARVAIAKKEWAKGKSLAAESLAMRESAIASGNQAAAGPDLARVLLTLGGAHEALNEMAEAQQLVRRAYDLTRDVANSDAGATAAGQLAGIIERQGGPNAAAEAETLYRERVNVLAALYGEDHSSTIDAKSSYAYFLANQQRDKEAVPIMELVLESTRKRYGNADRRTLDSMTELATALIDLTEYARAQSLVQEAIDGLTIVAPESAELASAHNFIGIIGLRTNNLDLAEKGNREALRIREKIGDGRAGNSMSNLAGTLTRQGKYAEADELYIKAIAQRRSTSGKMLSDFGVMLNNRALVLVKMERFDEAEALYKEADAFDRANRPGNIANARNLRPYAEFLILRGRAEEALPLAREAYELGKGQAAAEKARYALVLSKALEAAGKPEEAAPFKAEAEANTPKPIAPPSAAAPATNPPPVNTPR